MIAPTRKNCPGKEGWIRAELTLNSPYTEFTGKHARWFVESISGMKEDAVELSGILRRGSKAVFFYRSKPQPAAAP